MLEEINIPQSGQRLGVICSDNIAPQQPVSTGATWHMQDLFLLHPIWN